MRLVFDKPKGYYLRVSKGVHFGFPPDYRPTFLKRWIQRLVLGWKWQPVYGDERMVGLYLISPLFNSKGRSTQHMGDCMEVHEPDTKIDHGMPDLGD